MNRWQRTKVNNSYSDWTEIFHGVPQGSILGPLLFNIYLNDLFFVTIDTSLCNFADDNTLYACDISLKILIDKLESSATLVIDGFNYNYMKLNDSKCNLLVCGNKEEVIIAKIGNAIITESYEVKLLGAIIDCDISFKKHTTIICKKAGKKLNALARLCNILPSYKQRVLMKAFVMSQFSFSPLLSMFCNRSLNSKIDSLHFRSLRIVYNDDLSSFDELVSKDKSVRVHHRNIQFLAIEMYEVELGVAPSFMSDIFKIRDISTDSIIRRQRSPLEFYNYDIPKSFLYGEEMLRSLGPKVWHILPSDIKSLQNLVIFKNRIKLWIPKNCPSRLCKPYIANLGF